MFDKELVEGSPGPAAAALLLGLDVSALSAEQAHEVVLACERLVRVHFRPPERRHTDWTDWTDGSDPPRAPLASDDVQQTEAAAPEDSLPEESPPEDAQPCPF